MATYIIGRIEDGVTRDEVTKHTRPAAHRALYKLWYEYLGTMGGRDTKWGWAGVNAINAWYDRHTTDNFSYLHRDTVFTVTRED